ncbi:adventurous gliding motility lipoprotein CglB [Myxococcus sp. RHSTA-1-4]|uniref:adventurous gliding motility lipoprotein CglB n=1 Tax=Myxococcus sp. RHSTA-1-4 TaxID=2874601 RepID=UPI001CBE5251|nr:adventurous gliding motility lipoprotein CglB [Myxococcus sp. RHSTA-1-4]MBZ4415988.1 adventurous gliding motility lipoprotein CglB [Myxococcus sp. RHSTA-1-4]
MRAKQLLLSALALGTLSGVLAVGCQSYDFERVEPLSIAQTTVEETITVRSRKPNIMMLVDTSGSMTDPVDTSDPDCQVVVGDEVDTCGSQVPCNTAVCPTRWTELQAAVPTFLASAGPYARFGLTTYPETGGQTSGTAACRPSTQASVRKSLPQAEDDASLLAHANDINAIIQGIPNFGTGQPAGGTPTSLSLRFVGGLEGLQAEDRTDFVILLTDGLPNCNPDNVNDGTTAACKCTQTGTAACTGTFTRLGCLDQDASVTAVRELAARDITTIVIGFGAETASGNGPAVLDAMARAGGFARTCEAGQDSCGPNDPCDPVSRTCSRSFYQAGNQEELAQALEAISKKLLVQEPCLIKLDPSQLPTEDNLIVVYLDGERAAPGDSTWDPNVKANGGVLFTGAACQRIESSTPDAPVNIEIRAIRQR